MATSPIGAITVEQLLRSQSFVTGVRSRIGATGSFFQNFFNLGPDGPQGQAPVPPGQDAAVWDYFDNVRTMSEVRPALAGPARVIPQSVGTASGALIRFYEALMFEDNRIAGFRPPGKPVGTLSKAGEDYVARQLKMLLQKQNNSREFVISRMLRGGFDIKTLGGDRQILVESGSGQISINSQIPTAHKEKLPLDVASADIITASWATASTDIIGQMAVLRQVAERRSGLPIKHGLYTSKMYTNCVNNDKLRAAGGSAYRVWESLIERPMQTLDGMRRRGEDIEFRALPQVTFHVYDGVLNVDQVRNSLDVADNSLFIPNDHTIFTPEPGDWFAQVVGSEIIRENHGSERKTVVGTHDWVRNVIEPTAGTDLHVWNKYLPIIYVPNAVYYALTVF